MSENRDGVIERSARVSWSGGELRMRLRASEADTTSPAEDASPFLAVALLCAMRRHEDLEVDGAVSALLLESCEEIQSIYHSWDLSLRRCVVRAEPSAQPGQNVRGKAGAFFSRGVDSSYSAVVQRIEPLESLVFCEDLEPIHSKSVQARELELARDTAAAIGLPLVVVSSNVRKLCDPILNWIDAQGGGLAFIALSLGGGFRMLTVPSWADYENLAPAGSHPLLDPLFSTESVAIRHDAIAHGRLEKVGVLARERPEVLSALKVCFMRDTEANCGVCPKCLLTMCCLHVHGVLERATLFPRAIDLALVARTRLAPRAIRVAWLQVHRALDDRDPLKTAVARALRRSARPTVRERAGGLFAGPKRLSLLPAPWDNSGSAFFRHDSNQSLQVLRDGRPYP